MNRKILLCLYFHLCLFNQLSAQYENIWVFGRDAGIDFNYNPPKAIQTIINAKEGIASVCDASGQLLFYTDGFTAYDRNYDIMSNGKDLTNTVENITNSTAQGVLIIPVPGNSTQYYVFSIGCFECSSVYSGNLYYSLIDVSLNNGLGDVVSGSKGILLDKKLTEHMIAVPGENCNIWLLLLSRTDSLKAYSIGNNGIIDTNAILSAKIAGKGPHNGILGTMDVSPDRKKLAIAQSGNIVLYNFDAATGKISNQLVLDNFLYGTQGYYGACFSPDNTKLYATTGSVLNQFDLTSSDSNAIIASKISWPRSNIGALKRGLDGKMYVAAINARSLGVINKPNLAGTACEYVAEGFPLYPDTRSVFGLPNSIARLTVEKFYSARADIADCVDSMLLRPSNLNGSNYLWEDGSVGKDRYVNESGTYWITYQHSSPGRCEEYIDTFHVVLNKIKRTYTSAEFEGMCKTDTFLMEASNLNESNYLWGDGSTATSRKINQTGTYWVSYQNDSLCEHFTDTFHVTYPDPEYKVSFIVDTLICQNDTISFKNTSDAHFNEFAWSFGDGNQSTNKDPKYNYQKEGVYQVQVIGKINEVCLDTASATIVVDPFIPIDFLKDRDSICVGESINVFHDISRNTLVNLQWDFGDGIQLSAREENRVKHAYAISGIMPVTLSAQFRACPDASYTDTIYVFDLPEVDLGGNSSICLNGAPIYLKNLQPEMEGIFHYSWNTGVETETLKVTHPGIYSLTVSSIPMGCSTTESIEITRDCYLDIPNAFTPNGDGENDYFFPRQLLSKSLTHFNMRILNRWGQVIFETSNVDGRGWDGRFNGKEQPGGVYVYSITIETDGQIERYDGNVTLIR